MAKVEIDSITKCDTCRIKLTDGSTPNIMICRACQVKFYLNQIAEELLKLPIARNIEKLINGLETKK